MKYEKLVKELHRTKPNPMYYKLLLDNLNTLLLQIAKSNQGVVARDLDMSAPKLSHTLTILKALQDD